MTGSNIQKSMRSRVLDLFQGEKQSPTPVFSGMGNVTVHGIVPHGWLFPDIHTDANKMAVAAASTSQLFGFECAVAPFDMGVEAEALGCQINYYSEPTEDILFPTVQQKLFNSVKDFKIEIPTNLEQAGRIPLVLDAIRQIKAEVGESVAIGGWVLGPFTLAGQLIELDDLLRESLTNTMAVRAILDQLAGFIVKLASLYREAGVDYITVREMGASSDVINPRLFRQLILPPLQSVFAAIAPPRVLHICGTTRKILEAMAEAGAEAISIDHKNDATDAVKRVGDKVLVFGNLDAFEVLVNGTPALVRETVTAILDSGVDAIWPGCDVWPTASAANMEALMETVRNYKRK